MAIKEFTFHGKTLEEIKKMDLKEFARLIPSRKRRSILRGFTDQQKRFYDKVKKFKAEKSTKRIKTHLRDVIVLPEMVDLTIGIHNGKEFVSVKIIPEMLGSYLGELVMTRKRVAHSAPGVGATRSSAAITSK